MIKTCNFLMGVFTFMILLSSCDSKKNDGSLTSNDAMPVQEDSPVNANEQAKPNMLILPSDALLKKFGMLKEVDALGKKIYIRDFQGYMLKDPDSKFILSSIQSEFIKLGFPLNDLEQTLKSFNDQEMSDDADNVEKDAKTMLLSNAKPDIILELDYDLVEDMNSRNLKRSLTYSLRAIDAFSNKVIASIQQNGLGKDDEENNAGVLMKKALDKDLPVLTPQIKKYFIDIIQNGRDITLRVAVEKGVKLSMDDDCLAGDSYSDFIIDYLKRNAYRGAYKLQRNTDSEIFFQNVRIKTLNDNGTQFSAYDFAKELKKALDKGCGVKSKNITQGLGDAFILIKGM